MDRNKPRKPKDAVSLKKVARTYRKNTKPATNYNEGSRYFDGNANSKHLSGLTRKLDYKPKAKSATFGTDSSKGGGTSVRRAVKAIKKQK